MKRSLLILGIALIITLSVVWGYLLFFGAPESTRDFFANLKFGDTEDTNFVDTAPQIPFEPISNVYDPNGLQQLTLKPVIGYQEVSATTSSSTYAYYIEAGTGHIFSIDLATGVEVRLSNITVPDANAGEISTDGQTAVIQSGEAGKGELTVVDFSQMVDSATSYPLITAVYDFTLTETGQVLYTLKRSSGLQAFVYNLQTRVTSPIFTLPFAEAIVLWGESATADHYAYPKTTNQLEGYLYRVRNGSLLRLPFDGFGFSALVKDNLILSSVTDGEVYQSQLYDTSTNFFGAVGIAFIPDKCTNTNHTQVPIICGVPTQSLDRHTITDWYKGAVQFNDDIWGISHTTTGAKGIFMANLNLESGRPLDVIEPNIYETNNLYFINKTDRTLWKRVVQIDTE